MALRRSKTLAFLWWSSVDRIKRSHRKSTASLMILSDRNVVSRYRTSERDLQWRGHAAVTLVIWLWRPTAIRHARSGDDRRPSWRDSRLEMGRQRGIIEQ